MYENNNQLILTLIAESHALGEGPYCTVELWNCNDHPLWVNGRLAVNHPASPPHLREIDFLIRDASGRVAEFGAKVRIGLPQKEDFVELGPGEALKRSSNLAFYYVLEAGKEYEAEAVYENYFAPVELRGAPVWTGRLVSRPLIVTLAEADRVPA